MTVISKWPLTNRVGETASASRPDRGGSGRYAAAHVSRAAISEAHPATEVTSERTSIHPQAAGFACWSHCFSCDWYANVVPTIAAEFVVFANEKTAQRGNSN